MTQFDQTSREMADKTEKAKSSANFKYNRERAVEAGRKGGMVSGGNFKNNPSRAAEAGRKGGQISRRRSTKATPASQIKTDAKKADE